MKTFFEELEEGANKGKDPFMIDFANALFWGSCCPKDIKRAIKLYVAVILKNKGNPDGVSYFKKAKRQLGSAIEECENLEELQTIFETALGEFKRK